MVNYILVCFKKKIHMFLLLLLFQTFVKKLVRVELLLSSCPMCFPKLGWIDLLSHLTHLCYFPPQQDTCPTPFFSSSRHQFMECLVVMAQPFHLPSFVVIGFAFNPFLHQTNKQEYIFLIQCLLVHLICYIMIRQVVCTF